jgi:hypothetical protein
MFDRLRIFIPTGTTQGQGADKEYYGKVIVGGERASGTESHNTSQLNFISLTCQRVTYKSHLPLIYIQDLVLSEPSRQCISHKVNDPTIWVHFPAVSR